MTSSQEMMRRAAASRKALNGASTIKADLPNDIAKNDLYAETHPTEVLVNLVYKNLKNGRKEQFAGWFEPFPQKKWDKDELLNEICDNFRDRVHLNPQTNQIKNQMMGAICDYVALLESVQNGQQQGRKGVSLELKDELDGTRSCGVKVVTVKQISEKINVDVVSAATDGVEVVKAS